MGYRHVPGLGFGGSVTPSEGSSALGVSLRRCQSAGRVRSDYPTAGKQLLTSYEAAFLGGVAPVLAGAPGQALRYVNATGTADPTQPLPRSGEHANTPPDEAASKSPCADHMPAKRPLRRLHSASSLGRFGTAQPAALEEGVGVCRPKAEQPKAQAPTQSPEQEAGRQQRPQPHLEQWRAQKPGIGACKTAEGRSMVRSRSQGTSSVFRQLQSSDFPSSALSTASTTAKATSMSSSKRSGSEPRGSRAGSRAGSKQAARLDARRQLQLDLLAGEGAEERARQAFGSRASGGRVDLTSARAALDCLHLELHLGAPYGENVVRTFARLDTHGDGALAEAEFLELFALTLQNAAFEPAFRRSRSQFTAKRSDCIWDSYERLHEMGNGSFGKALLCRHRVTKEERAVKVVKKEKGRSRDAGNDKNREVSMLQKLDHPNVVRLFGWHEDPQKSYLVMEALQGGTLQEAIMELQRKGHSLREEWSLKVMKQVLEAMVYCHSLHVVHKDLKDENIMLLHKDGGFQSPFAIIIDFGGAELYPSPIKRVGQTVAGTPATMAPEVWSDEGGPKCDVWSLGCILFTLLSGRLPFISHGQRPDAWLALHRRGPDWTLLKAPSAGRDLCVSMLRFHEAKRPSMAECLAHRWFGAAQGEDPAILPLHFTALLHFCRAADVRRALLFSIANRLPMRKAHGILALFRGFGGAKGSLCLDDLSTALTRLGLHDDGLAKRVFSVLDADQDGALCFTEFAAGALLAFGDLLEDRFSALMREHGGDCAAGLSAEGVERLLQAILPQDLGRRALRLLEGLLDGPGGQGRLLPYAEIFAKLFGMPLSQIGQSR